MMLLLVINGISLILILCCMLGYASSQSIGDLRLVGGATYQEGRVEIYYNGEWGTVCDDSWDQEDAIVVCRQLRFGTDATAVSGGRGFPEGEGQIWLDDVQCTGWEDRLDHCLTRGWGVNDCNHGEDAGVRCAEGEKSVRLIDGENMHSGRVEIFFNGEWGTVCDDTFGKEEGQVICNQLGYPGDVQVYGNAEFGKGRGPIMDEINCFYPSGRDWMNCQIGEWDTTVCTHSEDVGLICLDALLHTDGDVRLVNGPSRSEGRVEIFYNNEWGTICDDNFRQNEGDVICHQLGFESALSTHLNAYYGTGDGPIMKYISCEGYESRWDYCAYEDWATALCSHHEDVGVSCTDIGGESVIGIIITAVVIILIGTCCCFICVAAIRKARSRQPRAGNGSHPPPQPNNAQPVPLQALKNQTAGTDDPPNYRDVVSNPAYAPQNYPQQPYPMQQGVPSYPAQPPFAPYPAQPGAPPYPAQPGVALYPLQPAAAPYPSQPGVAPYPSQPGIAPYPSQPVHPNHPATDLLSKGAQPEMHPLLGTQSEIYSPPGTQKEMYPQQDNPQGEQTNPAIPSAPPSE